ncbi:MAG TPA: PAS domain-containing protein [Microvirga sp.]|nr:PAS domain-containing protein [Microvirga sp.]
MDAKVETSTRKPLGFLAKGGETAALILAHDWSGTPLGPPETWPQFLRSALSICLTSSFPTAIYWGPEFHLLYNDAWALVPVERHPWAMGRPAAEVWPDIWDVIGPQLALVLESGEGFSTYDQMLPLMLSGVRRETYWNYSFTAIRSDDGSTVGVFSQGHETTDRVLGERRNRFLLDLSDRLRSLADPREVIETAQEALGRHLGANRVGYGEVEETARYFTTQCNWTDGSVPSREGTHDLAGFGPDVLAALRAGIPLLISDAARDPRTCAPESLAAFDAIDTRAVITASLVKEGRMQAALYVHAQEPRPWGEHDAELVAEVAERTWAAVERARAEARLRENEERQAFLLRLGDKIRRLSDPEAVVAATARALGERLGVTRVAYAEIDEAAGLASVPRGWVDETAEHLPERIRLADYGEILIERLRAGGTLRVDNTATDPVTCGSYAVLDMIAARALVSVPLFKDNRFAVSLNVHQDRPRTWTDSEVELIEAVAERTREAVERARSEMALREREALLQQLNDTLEHRIEATLSERNLLATIVETTDAQIQVLDHGYRWLAINKACADEYQRIFGKRPEIGGSLLELLSDKPEQQAAAKAVWSRALAGEAFTQVSEFGDRELDSRFYEMRFEVLRGQDGSQIGAFLTGRDVTERVAEQRRLAEAQAARREADTLYRAYFENAPEALFVIGVGSDGGFVVEEVNPAHETGVGFKIEDIRGKRIEDILPPSVAQQVLKTYRHVIETGAIHQYREEFDIGSEPQHWDTSLVPVRDADGRIVRMMGSSRNVTRQVTAEEALRQSQKMESMGQLTGGVAHDFNNLLTPIVGALDMLQSRGVGGEREQRLIAAAAQSAERAKTLVQRLLAFARRQPLQTAAVDVGKVVGGMADLVASTTGPQVKVVVEVADDLPPAKADLNQLEMALLNLAVNARDAMPGGGTLRISALAETIQEGAGGTLQPGRYVRLSVADTGVGMDEATLARAVEPFFSTKGIGKGTGLGLSMAHGLASQLGGALSIKSKLGLGTNVELWLPESADAPKSPSPADEVPHAHALGTVLLVDDEEFVRLSTAEMLSDLGYKVLEAATAEAGFSLAQSGAEFDLLITDHLMPGMTGSDLAQAVQALRPGVPILVISGYAETEGIVPDLPRLTKPFRKDELAAGLALLMKSSSF